MVLAVILPLAIGILASENTVLYFILANASHKKNYSKLALDGIMISKVSFNELAISSLTIQYRMIRETAIQINRIFLSPQHISNSFCLKPLQCS